MKDGYKINKEIVKMRNEFRNSNLRNQLIMKSDFKHITTHKSELVKYDGELLLNDIKIFNDDADQCIQDLQEDMSKLVLCNDSDFKINAKQRPEKITADNNNKVKNKNRCQTISKSDKKDKIHQTEEEDQEHSIRIECAFAYKSPETTQRGVLENTTEQENKSDESKKHVDHGLNAHVDDLQTLLIMMAITKSNAEFEKQHTSTNISNDVKNIQNENEANTCLLPIDTEKEQNTEPLHIVPIKIEMNERLTYIAKKYLTKWRKYLTKKKEFLNKQREETLNLFFDKLSKKKLNLMQSPESANKAKLLAQDFNTYQHR